MSKKTFSITLSEQMRARLQDIADCQDRSVNCIVNKAIEALIEEYKPSYTLEEYMKKNDYKLSIAYNMGLGE